MAIFIKGRKRTSVLQLSELEAKLVNARAIYQSLLAEGLGSEADTYRAATVTPLQLRVSKEKLRILKLNRERRQSLGYKF